MGRPSTYSEEIAEAICDRLLEGESLRSICAEDAMPDRKTVFRWLAAHPAFAAKYAHAREMQADYMDDLILDTAKAITNETALSDRVRIGAYQWRASKLKPKVYGDKTALVGGDPEQGDKPIQMDLTKLSDDQLRALAAIPTR